MVSIAMVQKVGRLRRWGCWGGSKL